MFVTRKLDCFEVSCVCLLPENPAIFFLINVLLYQGAYVKYIIMFIQRTTIISHFTKTSFICHISAASTVIPVAENLLKSV